jgi:hypothetical protein
MSSVRDEGSLLWERKWEMRDEQTKQEYDEPSLQPYAEALFDSQRPSSKRSGLKKD